MTTEGTNRMVLRALVAGRVGEPDRDESRALDPFSMWYGQVNGAIEPPYDPLQMTMLLEQSDVLRQIVDTLCTNIEGQGYTLGSWDGQELDEEDPDNEADKIIANDFLNSVFAEGLQQGREVWREDLEVPGNTYLEVLRETSTAAVKRRRRAERTGNPAIVRQATQGDPRRPWRMNNIAAFLMRIAVQSPDDDKMIDAEVYTRQNGEWVKTKIRRKFKKYVMADTTGGAYGQGGTMKRVYFKEFNDPRGLDYETGKYYKSDREVPKGKIATEIIHTRFPTGRSPYGISKYTGALLNIGGARKANECNYLLLDNQGIPAMAVLVSGGHITEASWEKVCQTFKEGKGVGRFNEIILLEAVSPEGAQEDTLDAPGKGGTIRIELKPLTDAQTKDALFLNFLKFCHQVIRSVRRVPPVLIGLSEDDSYASAEVSLKTFENQVCKGERLRFDSIVNNLLFPALGISQWKFVSNGIKIGSTSEIASLVSAAILAGVGDANEWARVIGPLLGVSFKDNPDLSGAPYEMKKAEAGIGASIFSRRTIASDKVSLNGIPEEKVADLIAERILRTLERAHRQAVRAAEVA